MADDGTPTREVVTILCPECGEVKEIHDVRALLVALHMVNECTVRGLIGGSE